MTDSEEDSVDMDGMDGLNDTVNRSDDTSGMDGMDTGSSEDEAVSVSATGMKGASVYTAPLVHAK